MPGLYRDTDSYARKKKEPCQYFARSAFIDGVSGNVRLAGALRIVLNGPAGYGIVDITQMPDPINIEFLRDCLVNELCQSSPSEWPSICDRYLRQAVGESMLKAGAAARNFLFASFNQQMSKSRRPAYKTAKRQIMADSAWAEAAGKPITKEQSKKVQ